MLCLAYAHIRIDGWLDGLPSVYRPLLTSSCASTQARYLACLLASLLACEHSRPASLPALTQPTARRPTRDHLTLLRAASSKGTRFPYDSTTATLPSTKQHRSIAASQHRSIPTRRYDSIPTLRYASHTILQAYRTLPDHGTGPANTGPDRFANDLYASRKVDTECIKVGRLLDSTQVDIK